MVQLDPFKTILVFSHIHNTYNKENFITNNPAIRETCHIPFNFFGNNTSLQNLYMCELTSQLTNYSQGESSNKPDVLNQMNNIQESRIRRNNNHKKQQIIDKIESGEIPLDLLESFLNHHSSEYLNTLLENKNKLIDKLLQRIKELQAIQSQSHPTISPLLEHNI